MKDKIDFSILIENIENKINLAYNEGYKDGLDKAAEIRKQVEEQLGIEKEVCDGRDKNQSLV